MLILSRPIHEVVRISGLIRVQLLGIKGNQVRLGIEAPPEVSADREDIYLREQKNANRVGGVS
jgi:carbon storage regulator